MQTSSNYTLTSSLPADETPDGSVPSFIAEGFKHALREAFHYCGATAPNPPVGCTILDAEHRILEVAAHHKAGMPHAEALALAQCRLNGKIDQAHTAIVTLEPCNHTGRTPPCTEALINSPIRHIWIGMPDPNPKAGGGIAKLQKAGFEVHNLMESKDSTAQSIFTECNNLLAPFYKTIHQHIPWITIKQALTPEGSMIPPLGQKTFTSRSSLVLAHQLRRATDAIITGLNTFLTDHPSFTVRHIPDHQNRAPRLLVICSQAERLPDHVRSTAEKNDFAVEHCRNLAELPTLLQYYNILWAMAEGGPKLLKGLTERELWDDWLTIQCHNATQDTVEIQQAPWKKTVFSPLPLFLSQALTQTIKS